MQSKILMSMFDYLHLIPCGVNTQKMWDEKKHYGLRYKQWYTKLSQFIFQPCIWRVSIYRHLKSKTSPSTTWWLETIEHFILFMYDFSNHSWWIDLNCCNWSAIFQFTFCHSHHEEVSLYLSVMDIYSLGSSLLKIFLTIAQALLCYSVWKNVACSKHRQEGAQTGLIIDSEHTLCVFVLNLLWAHLIPYKMETRDTTWQERNLFFS